MKVSYFSQIRYLVTRLALDVALLPIIVIIAYSLKFKLGWVMQNVFSVSYGKVYDVAHIEPYLPMVGVLVLIWIPTFYFVGMYRRETSLMPDADECIKVCKGVSLATMELMAVTFVVPFFPGSRYVVFYTWLVGIVLISVARLSVLFLETMLAKKGRGLRPALVIGADSFGQDVAEKIKFYPSLGMMYVGTLDGEMPEKIHFHLKDSFTLLGTPDQWESVVRDYNVDVIFVTMRGLESSFYQKLVMFCESENIELRFLSESADVLMGSVHIDSFDGLPFLTYLKRPVFDMGLFFKRVFDVCVSVVLLILLIPLFCVIAVMIKWVSPKGPVFYLQTRVGKDGKLFKMIKFRTMVPDAEKHTGPMLVAEGTETRYIPFGDCLRKASLDELPQLINVIKGNMSIVGPRPERPYFVDLYTKDVPYFPMRHQVRGGITGWAQVNGRSVLTRRPEHKIKYDLYYIHNWSFGLDIKILLKTILVVLMKEDAY